MENMLPGNSFPQICVVSVNNIVENEKFPQDYRRSVEVSNLRCLLISNYLRTAHGTPASISRTPHDMPSVVNANDITRGLQHFRLR